MSASSSLALEQSDWSNFEQTLSPNLIVQADGDAEADRLFQEAFRLVEAGNDHGDSELIRQAIEHYNQARILYQRSGSQEEVAATLYNLGISHTALGEPELALEYFNRSRQIYSEIGSLNGEIQALTAIRDTYFELDEHELALERWEEAAWIFYQENGDYLLLAVTLNNIGDSYRELNHLERALEIYEDSLQLHREIAGQEGNEVALLNKIGLIYYDLNDLESALTAFEEALRLSQTFEDLGVEARILINIGEIYRDSNNLEEALEIYEEALSLSREAKDQEVEAIVLNNIGTAHNALGNLEQALRHHERALQLRRETNDKEGEAISRYNIGQVYRNSNNLEQAREYYRAALSLHRELDNHEEQVKILNSIGRSYSEQNDWESAFETYEEALSLSRTLENQTLEAETLNELGAIYYLQLNRWDQALEYLQAALSISQETENRTLEASICNHIGLTYHEIGELNQALEYYETALSLTRITDNDSLKATALTNIGAIHNALGDREQALSYYEEALPIRRASGDLEGEAATLQNIGRMYYELENWEQALDYFRDALSINQNIGNLAQEGVVLGSIGSVNFQRNELEQASRYFEQALRLHREVGDRASEAGTLGDLSVINIYQQNLEQALILLAESVEIIEDLRGDVPVGNLRTTYFSSLQGYYQTKLGIEMAIGDEVAAFETSEAMRTRTLIELLAESNVQLDDAEIPTELRERERALEQSFRALETRRVALLQREPTADLESIRLEYENLLLRQRNLASEIRRANPVYASLSYPEPLTITQIQQQVLDADTVLLQYAVGEKQSYLFIVTHQGELITHTIPHSRADIQNAANNFSLKVQSVSCGYETQEDCTPYLSWLTHEDGEAQTLTQMILPSEIAQHLAGKKRLLIVADDILHTVPFAALPDPNSANTSTYQPLMLSHEIINAPSASTIAILREQMQLQEAAGQRPGTKTLAVIADPVFGLDDERMANTTARSVPTNESTDGTELLIADNLFLQQTWQQIAPATEQTTTSFGISRLALTGETAQKILNLVPDETQKTAVSGLAANQEWVMEHQNLLPYQHILFATHGSFNSDRPEKSGILLSLVDANGNVQDGYLTLREIFNLKLSAELVVLSACQSGRGENVRGEGIVGMTRGFMFAGAERLVSSLWNISAEAPTDQWLTTFYSKMLPTDDTNPLSPTEAFHQTQKEMFHRYPDPYYWAAFTIQGEWRP